MEYMPKSTQRVSGWVYFVIFEKYPWYFFVKKKKEGVPQAIFEKYHGIFLVIIILQFVSDVKICI